MCNEVAPRVRHVAVPAQSRLAGVTFSGLTPRDARFGRENGVETATKSDLFVLELERRKIQLIGSLHRGEGDGEVLDCKAGRVEHRYLVVVAPAFRLAGEDTAQLGDVATLQPAGLDRMDEVSVVARLLALVSERRLVRELRKPVARSAFFCCPSA